MLNPNSPFLLLSLLALSLQLTAATDESVATASAIESKSDGNWSSPSTWLGERLPAAGDSVLIRSDHQVVYDVDSTTILRAVHVSGVLRFRTDMDTRLEVGLIRIEAGDRFVEEGFDCDGHDPNSHTAASQAELWVGSSQHPIQAEHRCLIRLHPTPGVDQKSWPAIVCCGGRMEIHGAPMNRTWVKLSRAADAGATRLFLSDAVTNWRAGDRILVTGTARQEPIAGVQTEHVSDAPSSEVRFLASPPDSSSGMSMAAGSQQRLTIDQPLGLTHRGGEYSGEVANLSRNVVIESAEPDVQRGHTMYHHGSRGSISYAEFRHLGKEGVLGRYPIHYHLAGQSMRGSSVLGVSVWDSGNRWITIHGTQYLVVRDCVGYQSVGHGFFLEDGTETHNVLDRNLAVQALVGRPLPEQILPFDRNDGAGFWWANNLNAFTRNVSVECDQHGFRFEAEASETFDPRLRILATDGTRQQLDIRTLPFIRFADNEAHTQRRFGLNLGGIRGLTYQQFGDQRSRESSADSISGTTSGIGPSADGPLVIERFKAWDTHWGFHTYCPAVKVVGMDFYDCNYGIWRSVMDLHQYDGLSFRQIHSHAIFFPMGGYGPGIEMGEQQASYPNYRYQDKSPPLTIITQVAPIDDDQATVRGTAMDNGKITSVEVGGIAARSLRDDFAEWEAIVPSAALVELKAFAIDDAGNVEHTPHRLAADNSSQTHHPRRPKTCSHFSSGK